MSSLPGWPHPHVAPFHAGEQAAQRRTGVHERMQEIGQRVMRGAMPQQHRDFFPLLPFVVLGAADAAGQPSATLLAGAAPGFVSSPSDTALRIQALPPADDPLAPLLHEGAQVGLLGIELPTRRRNRANGVVRALGNGGWTLEVQQSFGNCPKYIQLRRPLALPDAGAAAPAAPRHATRLDEPMAAQLRAADTFFIATHAAGDGINGGSDVSHRGGRAGFVQVSDDGATLTWPDFIGNSFFNTLGNLMLQPRAGLVFPDFASGDLLHITGDAEIVWEGPQVQAFAGALRLVRLHLREALLRPSALPLRWQLQEESPALAGTGRW
ncbi:pyridoxamine 5'-phosphate oxidase family protein [Caldimonas sp. KR1-144]|uniref:pyridoxamine 5'-phosphate oxidase family protein n=1 Tax=Caldimonas sp. KR1-144 TaxID=3400911 RepID=UPI003C0ED371